MHESEKYYIKLYNRPHVVLLGAGATMAAIPSGDKNGMKCSVMYNFLKNMGLEEIEEAINFIAPNAPINNLETLYSFLSKENKFDKIRVKLENAVYNKMSSLLLPEEMTVYDYLILSLRGKDCIATFNWDPLLIQAYNRSIRYTRNLPRLLFLHGNVGISFCDVCGRYSPIIMNICPQCGSNMQRSPLLYPVEEKNYTDNTFISGQWDTLLYYIEDAGMLTIFGYSGPQSDVKALDLMYTAFNNFSQRLNQLEIIDIKDEKELKSVWQRYAKPTNNYYHICSSFFDSFIAEYPRRSIEGYVNRKNRGSWASSSKYLVKDDIIHNNRIIKQLICEEKDDGNSII